MTTYTKYFFAAFMFLIMGATTTPLQATAQSINAQPAHRFTQSITPELRNRFNREQSIVTNNNVSGSNSAVYYYNWSGYAVTGSGFNEVQSTYVQPTVNCAVPNSWVVFWVGFDGYNNDTVEQTGTAAKCGSTPNSAPVYFAWWEMYPTNYIQTMPITVSPGQIIQATVTYTASNKIYGLKVANLSNGQQNIQNKTCAAGLVCARNSAEWIVERPAVNGVYTSLANWGKMSLNSAQASNTQTYNRRTRQYSNVMKPISSYSNNPINMVSTSPSAYLLAIVSNLNTAGNSFTDTWQTAQ